MNYEARAKQIIEENIYLTLATASKDGVPWISPLYCVYDKDYNFYWTSASHSRHSQYLKENGGVAAFVIFNSSAEAGEGDGVYFEGKVREMSDEQELSEIVKIFYGRRGKEPRPASGFLNGAPRRMYKAVFERAWINDVEKIDGYIVDKKIELKLR